MMVVELGWVFLDVFVVDLFGNYVWERVDLIF